MMTEKRKLRLRKKLEDIFLSIGHKLPSDGLVEICFHINIAGMLYLQTVEYSREYYEVAKFFSEHTFEDIDRIEIISKKGEKATIYSKTDINDMTKDLFETFSDMEHQKLEFIKERMPSKRALRNIEKFKEKVERDYVKDKCKKLYKKIKEEYEYLSEDDVFLMIGQILYRLERALKVNNQICDPFKFKSYNEKENFLDQIRNKVKRN